ncbi:hypothetical protein AB0M11_30985, partial [Streptomyces sp. NPDC051987]
MADEAPETPKIRLDKGEAAGTGAPAVPPSLPDQRTVAELPGAGVPAGPAPQGRADPYAAPYADPYAAPYADPYAAPYADPYAAPYADPYAAP